MKISVPFASLQSPGRVRGGKCEDEGKKEEEELKESGGFERKWEGLEEEVKDRGGRR